MDLIDKINKIEMDYGIHIVNGIEFEKRREGYFYKDIYLWDINYIYDGTLTLMNVHSSCKLQIALGYEIFEQIKGHYRVLTKEKNNSQYTQCDSCGITTPKKYWSDNDYEICKKCNLII